MKLKNRDLNEGERKLETAGSQLAPDRIVRTGMLTLAVCGVAVLAGIAVYLICLSPPLQDSDPGVSAMRSWIK